MSKLASVAEHLIVSAVLNNISPIAGKNRTGQVLLALSGFLAFVGIGFLIVASYLWLGNNYSPEAAAAMTGGIALILALLSSGVAFGASYYRLYKFKKIKQEIIEAVQLILEYLNEEIKEPVEESPKTAVALASVAGFATGRKIF